MCLFERLSSSSCVMGFALFLCSLFMMDCLVIHCFLYHSQLFTFLEQTHDKNYSMRNSGFSMKDWREERIAWLFVSSSFSALNEKL